MSQNRNLVKVPGHIVNIDEIAEAHWEKESLYLHFKGGRFAQIRGREAELVWDAIEGAAFDVQKKKDVGPE